jgi:hypothetical protein
MVKRRETELACLKGMGVQDIPYRRRKGGQVRALAVKVMSYVWKNLKRKALEVPRRGPGSIRREI